MLSQYTGLPHYSSEQWESVKAQVTPLRWKFVESSVSDHMDEKIVTLLLNRRGNLLAPETHEKMGVALYGPSGSGKTKMIDKCVVPAISAASDDAPVPFVRFGEEASEKLNSAGHALTRAILGDMELRYNEKVDYWSNIPGRLKAAGTLCIHWDEAQDVFLAANSIQLVKIRRAIKNTLISRVAPTIFVLSGTLALKQYLENDEQLRRRFFHVTIPEISLEGDYATMVRTVEEHCAAVGLKNDLVAEDYALLIHAAAKRFGKTFSYCLDGIEEALLEGKDMVLTRLHLAYAFERSTDLPPASNPFISSQWQRLNPATWIQPEHLPPVRKTTKRSEQHW